MPLLNVTQKKEDRRKACGLSTKLKTLASDSEPFNLFKALSKVEGLSRGVTFTLYFFYFILLSTFNLKLLTLNYLWRALS